MTSNSFFVRYFDFFRTVAAILIGFIIALACIFFISDDPVGSVMTFVVGPFQSLRRFSNIIEYMIPVCFTALGMCMMLQVGEFNLIGEGVFFLSGAFTGFLATKVIPADFPPVLFSAVIILACALLGGIIALVPALLKIKWGANEVVITIMLNSVLWLAGLYILQYWMRDNNVTFLGSEKLPKGALLTKLLRGTDLHTGLFLAIIAIVFIWWFLYRTTKGYEIRMTGSNRSFALYAGIGVTGAMILAQIMGGALAGMGGAIEILGRYDRFKWTLQTGYGFDGMMIAVIARKNPALVPLAAFFLAYIRIGADIVGSTTDVPVQFILVIQAVIIMLVAATMFLDFLRKRAVVKESTANAQKAKGDSKA